MFNIDELLSKKNQARALAHFKTKRDGHGPDGVFLSELEEYWRLNGERVMADIRAGTYKPGIVRRYEIVGNNGKRRFIANMNVVDRFVERLLQQKLQRYLDPTFLDSSFAYREGRGAADAAAQARDYILAGCEWVCQVDIKDFFDNVQIGRVERMFDERISDQRVMMLLSSLLRREMEFEGKIKHLTIGLLQGSSISPVASNLYLHPLDELLEGFGWRWVRFADNIYVYAEKRGEAEDAYAELSRVLADEFALSPNKRKSGVFRSTERRLLGYDFKRAGSGIEVARHRYQRFRVHNIWHQSSLTVEHGVYHLVQDGIITQKDYGLLFEGDDERHHIPPEVTDQINVYGDVSIAPAALRTISERGIRIVYFDAYGRAMGAYTPTTNRKASNVFLEQCGLYGDGARRAEVARLMEIAGIHNMRVNLRYYRKRGIALDEAIAQLSSAIENVKHCASVEALMLVEARARKVYYEGFSAIVERAGFAFAERTKQPPKDPCNALISFGNTVLYGEALHAICKTSLDPKIGVVHATNRRSFSLNLDIADIFKPVLVDRVIFGLVNRHELKADRHFRDGEGGAVLLNDAGKRIFLEALENKLDTVLVHKGLRTTYRRLLADEPVRFQRLLVDGEDYRPYKYY